MGSEAEDMSAAFAELCGSLPSNEDSLVEGTQFPATSAASISFSEAFFKPLPGVAFVLGTATTAGFLFVMFSATPLCTLIWPAVLVAVVCGVMAAAYEAYSSRAPLAVSASDAQKPGPVIYEGF